MRLLGRDLSPFVRRTATVMNLLGLEYERQIVATGEDGDLIRTYNPLGRVPALILDDEVLIDSTAILDYVLELAEHQTLLPRSGSVRRRVTEAVGARDRCDGKDCGWRLRDDPTSG